MESFGIVNSIVRKITNGDFGPLQESLIPKECSLEIINHPQLRKALEELNIDVSDETPITWTELCQLQKYLETLLEKKNNKFQNELEEKLKELKNNGG
jgi:hypothetical protein